MCEWFVFRIAFRLERPCLVWLDQRNIQGIDARDIVHFSEIGLEINLVKSHFTLFDIAELETNGWFFVRAENAIGGKLQSFLREAGNRNLRIAVTAFGR